MGGEEQDALKVLEQQAERDANETRQKVRMSQKIVQKVEDASSEKKENQPDRQTEVKLKIEDSKMYENKLSIFASKSKKEDRLDIFANSKSVNLFSLPHSSNANGGTNIFKMAASSQPSVPTAPEDLNQLSSDGPQDNTIYQAPPEPTEKIMKYQYEPQTDKVAQFRLIRFKNGQSSTKQKVVLSLEKDKNKMNSAFYFIVRNEVTFLTIYEGFTVPKTNVESFMDREDNCKLWVLKASKVEGKLVPQRELVKLQFESKEEALRFRELVSASSEGVKKEE